MLISPTLPHFMPIFIYYLYINNAIQVFLVVSARKTVRRRLDHKAHSEDYKTCQKEFEGKIRSLTLLRSLYYA